MLGCSLGSGQRRTVRVNMKTASSGQGGGVEVGGNDASGAVAMPTLSQSQRRLVREHLGLIGVHLRRHVGNLAQPRFDREREDLFQEGCLGLMRAVVDFDESRGIPFPAFALPRIHNAVSRALESKFSTIYVPARGRRGRNRGGRGGGDCGSGRGGSPDHYPDPCPDRHRPDAPLVRSISDGPEQVARCAAPSAHEVSLDRETLGDRLRGKYERAVRRACELVSRRGSVRGDRRKLAEVIAEERLLVPEETHRRALRQIARDTGSSYARVADCERGMLDRARAMLVGDPEFCTLRRRAKATEGGVAAGLDDAMERELALASATEFMKRFSEAGGTARGAMLERLLHGSRDGFADIIKSKVAGMDASQRERLLAE